MAYVRPDVIATRVGLAGSPLVRGGELIVAIVANTRGQSVTVVDEAVIRGAGSGVEDSLANSNVRSIVRVGDTQGAQDYTEDLDFTLTGDDALSWVDAPALPPPEIDTPSILAQTGGSWSGADTYSYVITALDNNSVETPVSNVVSIQVTDTAQTVRLTWGKVTGASGYRIYRRASADGDWAAKRLASISSGATTTYTDIGNAVGVGTPPTDNDTMRQPQYAATYYVSYKYADYSAVTNSPKTFYNMTEVHDDHGFGSDASNAARLVLGPAGVGNGASRVLIVAPTENTIPAFQIAVDALKGIECHIVCIMRTSTALNLTGIAHAEYCSRDEQKRERLFLYSIPSGAEKGDAAEAGTILYTVAQANGSGRAVCVVPDNASLRFGSYENHVTGSYDTDKNVNCHWLAAAIAGRIVSLPDEATPLTGKVIRGADFGPDGTVYYEEAEKDDIAEAGGCMIEFSPGGPRVRHGITANIDTVEDQEISIRLAEDRVRRELRGNADRYKGRKINDRLLSALERTTSDILAVLVKDDIIRSYQNISCTQDSILKTKVHVSFEYAPIYPCNVISFEYAFDLS